MADIHEALARARAAGDHEAVKIFEADLARTNDSVMNEPTTIGGHVKDVAKGLLSGIAAPGMTVLNLTRNLGPQAYQNFVDRAQGGRDRLREGLGTPGKVGETVGEIGVSMFPASRAAQATRAIPYIGRAAAPVVEGATAGGMTSPNDPLAGVVGGGEGGALGGVVGKTFGGVYKGLYGNNPIAARLRAEGLDTMTPGQARGGLMESAERAWEKLPVVGGRLKKSRAATYENYPRAKMEATRLPHETGDLFPPGQMSVDDMIKARNIAHATPPPAAGSGAALLNRPPNPAGRQAAEQNLAEITAAAQASRGHQGGFTPIQLEGQVKPSSPMYQTVREDASLLNRSNPSDNDYWRALGLAGVVGDIGSSYLFDTMKPASAPLWLANLAIGTKTGRKFITGDLAPQKKMSDLIRRGLMPSPAEVGGVVMGSDKGESNAP